MPTWATSSSSVNPADDRADACEQFNRLVQAMQSRLNQVTQNSSDRIHLFTTATPDLYELFLNTLPTSVRQIHVCEICGKFLRKYGGLVTIAPNGETEPLLWTLDDIPEIYQTPVRTIHSVVDQAAVKQVFLSNAETWGIPEAGGWPHFALMPTERLRYSPSLLKNTSQALAEKLQDYEILQRGLSDFPLDIAKQAQALLTSGNLSRSEKCIGVANWLVDLQTQLQSCQNQRQRDNLRWLAVAQAPTGFCHLRSSMIGTLLEDIQLGLSFEDIRSRFDAKMDPLKYQRPVAAPTAGNVARAEKIIEQLKTAGALERRFAKLDDLEKLWIPQQAQANKSGIFGHLKTRDRAAKSDLEMPPSKITWEKFARTILPDAVTIEYLVPVVAPIMALVTAQNSDAPPMLQWDSETQRNPVSWFYPHPNPAVEQWNLQAGVYQPVSAIVLQPTMWHNPEKFAHQGKKVFFLIKDARPMGPRKGGGFFPEFLKNEYREIRSTIEAYTKEAALAGWETAEACGVGMSAGGLFNQTFRVTTDAGVKGLYKIDRWD